LAGEHRVAAANPDHLIIRTSWPYGPDRSNVVDTVRARVREGGILRVARDRFGSPTNVDDLAAAVEQMALSDRCGTVHFANAGSCSQYDLAREILGSLDAAALRLETTSGQDTDARGGLPASAVLDTTLFTEWTGVSPRPWREALAGYLGLVPVDQVNG
jgi:dTDP-4-dehydrorhamnose reductase